MNILIAGISGYIGGRLLKELSKKNKVYNYKDKIPKKVDLIINVAGPDRDYCNKYTKKCIKDRININKKILNIIKKKKVKKYIHISTIHVYKKSILIDEKSNLDRKNSYSLSHINSENFIINNFSNCNYIIFRVSNCFGHPIVKNKNCWKLVINNIVKNIFVKKKIVINSKENFFRDYIGISYLISIIKHYMKLKLRNEIINICSEKPISIIKFCKIIKKNYEEIFNKEIRIEQNIKKSGKIYKIKSKKVRKKIKNKIDFFFQKDLTELLLYCKKNFNLKYYKKVN